MQDGERAQIVYLLEINHLQLKQHMQLARETAVAQMDAFLDKLLDVTLAKVCNFSARLVSAILCSQNYTYLGTCFVMRPSSNHSSTPDQV